MQVTLASMIKILGDNGQQFGIVRSHKNPHIIWFVAIDGSIAKGYVIQKAEGNADQEDIIVNMDNDRTILAHYDCLTNKLLAICHRWYRMLLVAKQNAKYATGNNEVPNVDITRTTSEDTPRVQT